MIKKKTAASFIFGFFLMASGPTHADLPWSTLLLSEPTRGDASYIAPNEFANYVQFKALSRYNDGVPDTPRAVISVGTFRAFNLAASLRRDYLLSLDFAPGVTAFNRALAKVICKYSRRQFLDILLSLSPEPNLNRFEERGYFNSQIKQFIKKKSLAQAPATDADLQFILETLNDPNHHSRFYQSLLESSRSDERWAANFWGSEKGYVHLQKIIKAGHFVAVTGSLSGTTSLASMGRFLAQQNLIASEVDVSNALEPIVNSEHARGIRAFVVNLKQLPMDKNSRVLLTVNSYGVDFTEERPVDQWYYKVFTPEQIENSLSRVATVRQLALQLLSLPSTPVVLQSSWLCRDLMRN